MLETRNFLVPDATFVIEMVAFIVVLVVMTRYVVPRIRRAMAERQNSIAAALAAADAAAHKTESARAEAARILAEARRDASAITDQARAMREHLVTEGRAVGVEEYRWLAGRADRELLRRSEVSSRYLRQQARAAAVAAVTAHLGDDVDITSLTRLVDKEFAARVADTRDRDDVVTLPASA
jgi:F-type H+-transporting ATPase subunit b